MNARYYTKVRAGWFWGIATNDAGRVRNQDVYKIWVGNRAYQVFWFLPLAEPVYEYYLNLPQLKGVTWYDHDDHEAILALCARAETLLDRDQPSRGRPA
jgi:hypothetical protein